MLVDLLCICYGLLLVWSLVVLFVSCCVGCVGGWYIVGLNWAVSLLQVCYLYLSFLILILTCRFVA